MIWIFGVITVALLAVMAQMLLLFQKRSNEIKIRQDPLRRRIEHHYTEMENSFSRIEDAAIRGQEEISFSIDHLRKQRDALNQAVTQLQAQVLSEDPPSEEEEVMIEVAAAAGEKNPRTLLREAQSRFEEIEVYIGELEKDSTNIKRNMERIGVKMRRKNNAEPSKEEGEEGGE